MPALRLQDGKQGRENWPEAPWSESLKYGEQKEEGPCLTRVEGDSSQLTAGPDLCKHAVGAHAHLHMPIQTNKLIT